MDKNISIEAIEKFIREQKSWNRSAWGRGVTEYAVELLENLGEYERITHGHYRWHIEPARVVNYRAARRALLNGADSWEQFSWGGCSLIYNSDIAERLCSPSELKRTKDGERRPNSREEWLDVQARALRQAAARVITAMAQLGLFEA